MAAEPSSRPRRCRSANSPSSRASITRRSPGSSAATACRRSAPPRSWPAACASCVTTPIRRNTSAWWPPASTNPTARVEYALRADELLSEPQVRQIMEYYLAVRMRRYGRPFQPTGVRLERLRERPDERTLGRPAAPGRPMGAGGSSTPVRCGHGSVRPVSRSVGTRTGPLLSIHLGHDPDRPPRVRVSGQRTPASGAPAFAIPWLVLRRRACRPTRTGRASASNRSRTRERGAARAGATAVAKATGCTATHGARPGSPHGDPDRGLERAVADDHERSRSRLRDDPDAVAGAAGST